MNGCVFVFERLPVGLVQAWSGSVTAGANSVIASSVATVIKGGVDSDVRRLALGVGACDGDVALAEMPVS